MNILAFILSAFWLAATGPVSFDSVSYDFGSQPKNVESLEHVFRFTNDTGSSVRVSYAVATCSCTKLSWSGESIAPGGTGFVKAIYYRERNVSSFEKFISVFFEGTSKPVVLRIAGSFYETSEALAAEFPVSRGPVGLMFSPIRYGNVLRGANASDTFWAANLSPAPARITFTSLSDSLDIYPADIVIQPKSRQRFTYSVNVDSTAWGLRSYNATPVVNGTAYEPVQFTVVVIEDYSSLPASERNAAPRPIVEDRECSFGTVRSGRPAEASFRIRNSSSESPLRIRAVFCEDGGMEIAAPSEIEPGQTAVFRVSLAPAALVRGANSFKVCVQSDSPLRQTVEVYVTGKVE